MTAAEQPPTTQPPITALPMHHLLVPLDGSRLAEAALPVATSLAKHLGAKVTLLHILERDAPATIHGERHLTSTGEAEAYFYGVASRFADAGIPVELHVHPSPEGDVASSIAVHALAGQADLVVLCTHGQGGLRGWLSGAIAQRVVRHGGAPVLMIRPAANGTHETFAPQAMLVALDGTPEGEVALPAALTLAQALGIPLHLLIVVATLGTISGDRAATAILTPTATSAALDLESAEAETYLERLRLRLGGVTVPIHLEVGRGETVRTVMERAAQQVNGVVALATHGRAGFDALWSGSVGSKVVARASGPLLLVRSQLETVGT